MTPSDEKAIAVIRDIQDGRSINQFARDLGMDPGQLWRVLNGEQGSNGVIVRLLRLYPDRASDIAKALAAPEAEAPAPVALAV